MQILVVVPYHLLDGQENDRHSKHPDIQSKRPLSREASLEWFNSADVVAQQDGKI